MRPASLHLLRIARAAALCAAALAVPVLTVSASAQAAFGWPQYQGDAAHTGAAEDGPAPGYDQAWAFAFPLGGKDGTAGLSPPVIAGDLAIAVGPDQVVAIDVTTGAEAWDVDKGEGPPVPPALAQVKGRDAVLFTEGLGAGSGTPASSASATATTPTPSSTTSTPSSSAPTATPSAQGGPAVEPRLVAIDLRTREPLWSVTLPGVSRSGVTVDGGRAFVGDTTGTVTAVELASGTTSWSVDVGGRIESPVAANAGTIVASPIGDQQTNLAIVALHESDGAQAWRAEPRSAAAAAGPVTIAGELAFVGLADQTVRAFEMGDGAERWSARLNAPVNFLSGPALTGDDLIVADLLGQVYRLDAATGARVWDQAVNLGQYRSPPLVLGDHVLVPFADGSVAAIELATGDLIWRSDAAGGPIRDLVPAGDRLIGVRGGNDAGLVAFEHDPDAALVRVVTPTKVDPAKLLGWFVAAAVPIVALGWIIGRLLVARVGAPATVAGGARDDDFDEDDDDLDRDDVSAEDRP